MNTRSDIAITANGVFTKIGRKHYRHNASGMEIKFDAVKSGWRTPEGYVWPQLRTAAEVVVYNAGKAA